MFDWYRTLKDTSDEEIIPYLYGMSPTSSSKLFSGGKIWEDLMGFDLSFEERHIYVGSATGVWGGWQK